LTNASKLGAELVQSGGLRGIYAGIVPFAATNLLCCYTFYALYSKSAQ